MGSISDCFKLFPYCLSDRRSYSSGSVREGDSLGSQNSDFGIIPKIRISGTEGTAEIHSPGKTSVTSGGADPSSPKASASASGSKNYAE